MPTAGDGDNGNGRITLAVLATKLDNIATLVNECKIGLTSAMVEMHRQDKEIATIKTELSDFLEFKRAIIKQIAVILLGGISLTGVITYVVTNLNK